MTKLESLIYDMFMDGFPPESVPWLEEELQEVWLPRLASIPAAVRPVSKAEFRAFSLSGALRHGADYGRWVSPRIVFDLYEPDRLVGGHSVLAHPAIDALDVPFATEPANLYVRHPGPAHERIAWSLGTAVEGIVDSIRQRVEERSPPPSGRQLCAAPVEICLRRQGFLLDYYLYTHVYVLPAEG